MSKPAFVPSSNEVIRETLIVLAGAVGAALLIGMMPGIKAWMKKQWGDTPREF